MPSRLSLLGVFCAVAVVLGGAIPRAIAAGHKGKAVAKKPAPAAVEPKKELLTDERAISKQMSWEDKVMGSNAAKKAELAKIARAQAITKAAEAAAAAAPVVREPPVAAAPKTNKGTVNLLPTVAEEEARNKKVSSKLAMPEAAAPVPPPKPTDDRFIDKLLTSDGKKKPGVKMSNDHELEQLLTKESEKPGAKNKGKKGKTDVVDSVLENAGKTPETPVASKGRSPDWERLEAPATPPPLMQVPIAVRKTAKPDDGVIHVVQGANYAAGATASRAPSPPVKPAEAPARGSNWKDPFADNPSSGRKVASVAPTPAPPPAPPRAAPAPTPVVVAAPVASVPLRKESAARADSAGWKDPFAEAAPEHSKPSKRAAAPEPAVEARAEAAKLEPKAEPKKKAAATETATRPTAAAWKDPFSDNSDTKREGAEGRQKELTSSVPQAATDEEPAVESKWKVAARRPATAKAAQAVDGRARWSVLKRR